ncbi:recombinase family protein [Streptomyces sp. NPDC020794]|uniref:recombinase family protein n=1 Tax=unclassified Streptomyces TaxID=2593676 RepID=UPI0036E81A44
MSTGGQKPDRQIDALTAGDTLAVPALDRYGRSLKDLVNTVGELRRREIGFSSLHERLDTTTPGGRPTVATPTLYNHVPDLQELRASGRVPKQSATG